MLAAVAHTVNRVALKPLGRTCQRWHNTRVERRVRHEKLEHARALLAGERDELVTARTGRRERARIVLLSLHRELTINAHLRRKNALHAEFNRRLRCGAQCDRHILRTIICDFVEQAKHFRNRVVVDRRDVLPLLILREEALSGLTDAMR